jgi:hypothetical protein
MQRDNVSFHSVLEWINTTAHYLIVGRYIPYDTLVLGTDSIKCQCYSVTDTASLLGVRVEGSWHNIVHLTTVLPDLVDFVVMAGNDYSRHLPAYNEFCNATKVASGGVHGVIEAVLLSIQKSYEVHMRCTSCIK